MMDMGKNELPPEFLQRLKDLREEDSWCGCLKPTMHLFTYLEIVKHLKESPFVYKNSDILRRRNNENTIIFRLSGIQLCYGQLLGELKALSEDRQHEVTCEGISYPWREKR